MRKLFSTFCLTLSFAAARAQAVGHYAMVNGIRMYYEVQGTGSPLVLIHGGGSTIGTSFGRLMPLLAKTHMVIAVEMQAHGHTGDRNAPETFAQDAADITALLKQLNIPRADILGFSNGGHTTLELGINQPSRIRKLIIASAFYNRSGAPEAFWKGFDAAKFSDMPQVLKTEFLKIHPGDTAALLNMFHKDVERMYRFKGWTADELKSIKAPTLIVAGDQDVLSPEHAAEMYRLIPGSHLVVLPGGHGAYMGEAMSNVDDGTVEAFATIVNEFLAQ